MRLRLDDIIIGVAVTTVVVVITGSIAVIIWAFGRLREEEKEWRAFAIAHECKIVGEMSGSSATGYGVMANGKYGVVSTYTSGKTGYQCNNGVTYWR